MHYHKKLCANKFCCFPSLQNRWSFSRKKTQQVESEEVENAQFTPHATFVFHNASFGSSTARKTHGHGNWHISQATATSFLAFRYQEMHSKGKWRRTLTFAVCYWDCSIKILKFPERCLLKQTLKTYDGRSTCDAFTTDGKLVSTRGSERKVAM